MHIHLLKEPEPHNLEILQAHLEKTLRLTMGEIRAEHSGAKILVAGRPSREQLAAFPALQALIVPWTGIPPGTLELVREFPDLTLHNLHHNAAPVAEMAVALLLAAAKRIIPFDQALRKNDWRLRYQPPETILLERKRALILGYGEIGRRIGTALEGLGLEVVFIRRRAGADQEPGIYPPSALEELLPEVDFLVLALPLTAQTEGWIGEKELRLLPSSAVLVNVARGKVIDEVALFKALSEKWIFGAGLDVWFNYPGSREERGSTPPGEYPWGDLDNLVLSPHRGGLVRETEGLRMSALAELLNQAARGLPLSNRVDPDLGY
ncbi:MAG TPA: hydroxyacid dehydrogenase [Chloroflexi bacterium]|nr:hydroxyacid dehydrogenase [Chloroflexota bacterium]